jgi:8-oxo-dGTP pyrophosphatase MutT (NUDIX family)
MNLESITDILTEYTPRKIPGRHFLTRSSVAVVLKENDHPTDVCVLLMRRAVKEGDPWSGHMSFPGGRRGDADPHGLAAAIRELHEEAGVQVENYGNCIGRLSEVITRTHEKWTPMVVTPYVFQLNTVPEFTPNHEVESFVWVPLSFLADDSNRKKMPWRLGKINLRLPYYLYHNYKIWGLTLIMLDDLIRHTVSQKSGTRRGLFSLLKPPFSKK